MTIKQALRDAVVQLRAANIETAELDARLLLAAATGFSRIQLIQSADILLPEAQAQKLQHFIEQRVAHKPVARILGEWEFWSLNFKLSPATLVPRPESELIVEQALQFSRAYGQALRVLDIGTGSSCLILSVLHELPNAIGVGVDISTEALITAQENAMHLGMVERVEFIQSDLAAALGHQKFDLVISNPPYIPTADIETLEADVREYDPMLALDGGATGLEVYARLIPQAAALLVTNGMLILEIGIHQSSDVVALCIQAGFAHCNIHKDLAGIDRVITAVWPE